VERRALLATQRVAREKGRQLERHVDGRTERWAPNYSAFGCGLLADWKLMLMVASPLMGTASASAAPN